MNPGNAKVRTAAQSCVERRDFDFEGMMRGKAVQDDDCIEIVGERLDTSGLRMTSRAVSSTSVLSAIKYTGSLKQSK